jgi:hypothetical protein
MLSHCQSLVEVSLEVYRCTAISPLLGRGEKHRQILRARATAAVVTKEIAFVGGLGCADWFTVTVWTVRNIAFIITLTNVGDAIAPASWIVRPYFL